MWNSESVLTTRNAQEKGAASTNWKNKFESEDRRIENIFGRKVGASKDVIRRWAKTYQEQTEAWLRSTIVSTGTRRRLPGPVREKIAEIKKRELLFGVKRISHLLKQALCFSVSLETVQKTLGTKSDRSLSEETPAFHTWGNNS